MSILSGIQKQDWDPRPSERVYFMHHLTGDRGYLVKRGGKEHIRFDRPGDEIVRPFRKDEWVPDLRVRPKVPSQIARVAWDADQSLTRIDGGAARRVDWMDLTNEQRLKFLRDGPTTTDELRQNLFRVIMGALAPLTNPNQK